MQSNFVNYYILYFVLGEFKLQYCAVCVCYLINFCHQCELL